MQRTILIHGLASGAIIILGMIATIVLSKGGAPHSNVWLGYLIMLVGLSSILLAVKSHRDKALGGVIKFWPALLVGLAVALVAGIAYVLIWEVYLALTNYTFMEQYVASTLAQKKAAGLSGAEYAKLAADLEAMKRSYANPLLRMPMTFTEIFPVGVLVALVSAALVRNPKFLPAKA
ncbi:DUF4199 domain-containing protein [Caulobacter vibrioides]|uniref:DUF4199 domain-containing protein n=1 Tax=Caulobacter vibrioides TaxID=155892 RepID=UPI000BB488E6|nr:DUF4199 domain-containing protein [Caulobacter vibrioides]ATC24024.1 DUF4199 domain-containing protein [Caulobacter vibrioides]AZH12269.1 DUF4199 domain-containing protein [Caulobacter vibrioides]PLR10530.1 DUF4199 domain-containing protein [Caulobacter vibrioides]